ncbi:MAG TPA: hypothetical protein VNG51_15715 [Ktedonobacteraceae bacterium]|nr:hypothetical protein [Ktedonobacteraceae bacterium]
MHEYLKDVPQIITVIAVKEMVPEATEVMTKYGCTITFYDNYCEVQFPAGTTREEIIPRMLQSVRYNIVLPDGFSMMQVWVRHLGMSIFYYEREQK